MRDNGAFVALKFYRGELNPFDGAALEYALRSEKSVTAVALAPESALPALRALTRLGIRAVLVTDPAFAGSDTIATSYTLARAFSFLGARRIYTGRKSVDGETAQVPPMLARRLGLPFHGGVVAADGARMTLRSGDTFEKEEECVVAFEKLYPLRFPSILSREGEVEILDRARLALPAEKCGLAGSPTRVVRSYESEVGRRQCEFVPKERLPELIRAAAGKTRAARREMPVPRERLGRCLYAGDTLFAARALALSPERLVTEGRTAEEIAETIGKSGVRAVLFGDGEDEKRLAAETAVLLSAGLAADCVALGAENGEPIATRPALGGDVTADIAFRGLALATVRTERESERIVFSAGRGAAGEIGRIRRAAERYGAELCCSRPIADEGLLPCAAQVGLTGKRVSPDVYVAFGISGAVQHVTGFERAGTVIAVDRDRNSKIFDYADYGVVAEVQDVEL